MAKKSLTLNPWISIWAKPQKTIREIVKFDTNYRLLVLAFLYGFPMLLQIAQNLSLGEDYSLTGILIGSAILALGIGLLEITVLSGLIYWTGKWIGGKGSYQQVRTSVAWSNVPNILMIFGWFLLLTNLAEDTFIQQKMENIFKVDPSIVEVVGILQVIAAIWALLILIKGLAQIQKFSSWKSILNLFIPAALVVVGVWASTWVYWFIGELLAYV